MGAVVCIVDGVGIIAIVDFAAVVCIGAAVCPFLLHSLLWSLLHLPLLRLSLLWLPFLRFSLFSLPLLGLYCWRFFNLEVIVACIVFGIVAGIVVSVCIVASVCIAAVVCIVVGVVIVTVVRIVASVGIAACVGIAAGV